MFKPQSTPGKLNVTNIFETTYFRETYLNYYPSFQKIIKLHQAFQKLIGALIIVWEAAEKNI